MSANFTGIVPNNYPTNSRAVVDANFVQTVALPATATTAYTNYLDLQVATPFPTTETVNVGVNTTASVNGNSVATTLFLQHCGQNVAGLPDTANWANIPLLGNVVLTQGASSTAASTNTYKLPPGCKEYIRAGVTAAANTANLSDATLTLELLF